MKFLALLLILFSTKASAEMINDNLFIQRYCFSDINHCVTLRIAAPQGKKEIFFDTYSDWTRSGSFGAPQGNEVRLLPPSHAHFSPEMWEHIYANTITSKVEEALKEIIEVPEEEWNYKRDLLFSHLKNFISLFVEIDDSRLFRI